MMFNYFEACRVEFQMFIYFIQKFFEPAIWKSSKQFFFRKPMGNYSYRNIFDLFLTFSDSLFSAFVWFGEDLFQLRFLKCRVQIYRYFCFIENEAKLVNIPDANKNIQLAAPIFHVGQSFFRRTSEPLLAQIYNLFCQKVHTFLKLLGCLRKFLAGLGGCHEHFDQYLFVKVRKFLLFQ